MVQTAMFDLYYVFVEVVFGSIWLSFFGICALIAIIGMLSRMSVYMIGTILFFFTFVFMAGYAGAIFVVPMFFVVALYAIYSLIKFLNAFTPIGT